MQAGRDAEWSVLAAYAMAEVSLNPENGNLCEEVRGTQGRRSPGDNAEATKAANQVLQEVSGRSISYGACFCFIPATFMLLSRFPSGPFEKCSEQDRKKHIFQSPPFPDSQRSATSVLQILAGRH